MGTTAVMHGQKHCLDTEIRRDMHLGFACASCNKCDSVLWILVEMWSWEKQKGKGLAKMFSPEKKCRVDLYFVRVH